MEVKDIETTFDFLYFISDSIGSKQYTKFGKTVGKREITLQEILRSTAAEFLSVMKALESMAASYLINKIENVENLSMEELAEILNSHSFNAMIQKEITLHMEAKSE